MKLLTTTALMISCASATIGADCSNGAGVCRLDGAECCGVATPDPYFANNQATGKVTVCNYNGSDNFQDPKNSMKRYSFKSTTCTGAWGGATNLATGASIVAMATYYFSQM